MDFDKGNIFGRGKKNVGYAQYFDGQSYLCPLGGKDSLVSMANVTFEPGCRNHWHIHHAKRGGGQILLVTAGEGYYQEWGKEPRKLKPGDVVVIRPEVKHWHGAAPHSWFSTLPSRFRAKKRPMNGSKRSTRLSTMASNKGAKR